MTENTNKTGFPIFFNMSDGLVTSEKPASQGNVSVSLLKTETVGNAVTQRIGITFFNTDCFAYDSKPVSEEEVKKVLNMTGKAEAYFKMFGKAGFASCDKFFEENLEKACKGVYLCRTLTGDKDKPVGLKQQAGGKGKYAIFAKNEIDEVGVKMTAKIIKECLATFVSVQSKKREFMGKLIKETPKGIFYANLGSAVLKAKEFALRFASLTGTVKMDWLVDFDLLIDGSSEVSQQVKAVSSNLDVASEFSTLFMQFQAVKASLSSEVSTMAEQVFNVGFMYLGKQSFTELKPCIDRIKTLLINELAART